VRKLDVSERGLFAHRLDRVLLSLRVSEQSNELEGGAKMIRRLLALCMLIACATVVTFAGHPATFVLRNGDRVSGELTYKGGTSYTLNGRDYPSDDIAMIEFAPGDPSAAELAQIPTVDNNPSEHERHVFVTRNGEVIFGKVYHISPDGNTITFDRREGGRQDISADQLARVYVNPAGARSVYRGVINAATPVATTGAVQNGITVNANQQWTDTGVTVNRGDHVSFTTSGTIQIAPGTVPELTATVDGSPSVNVSRAKFPVPSMAVGGLVGRVGNSVPFPIGSNPNPIVMPASGRLYLGVNDDQVHDNSGAFVVSVRK
jgi:hypothetical protein